MRMSPPTARAYAELRTAAANAPRLLQHVPTPSPCAPTKLRLLNTPKYDAWTKLIKRLSLKLMRMESMLVGGAVTPPQSTPQRLFAAPRPHNEAVERRGGRARPPSSALLKKTCSC